MFEEVQASEEKTIQQLFAEFANAFHALARHPLCPQELAGGIIDVVFEQARDIHDAADTARLQLIDFGQQIGDGQEVGEVVVFPELVV